MNTVREVLKSKHSHRETSVFSFRFLAWTRADELFHCWFIFNKSLYWSHTLINTSCRRPQWSHRLTWSCMSAGSSESGSFGHAARWWTARPARLTFILAGDPLYPIATIGHCAQAWGCTKDVWLLGCHTFRAAFTTMHGEWEGCYLSCSSAIVFLWGRFGTQFIAPGYLVGTFWWPWMRVNRTIALLRFPFLLDK